MPFKKGEGGRKKGAVGKLTKSVRDAFTNAFNELQMDDKVKLTAWGKENPTEFYRLASKLIPTEVKHEVGEETVKQLVFVSAKEDKD